MPSIESEATTSNNRLSQLTRLLNEHQGDLNWHMKVVQDFRTHVSQGQDSESPSLVVLNEEQLRNLEDLSQEFKATLIDLSDCLSALQASMITIPTGAPERGRRPPQEDRDRRWAYEESLSKAVERWKSNAKKRREKGCRSLVEWYRELGPDEGKEEEREERKALSFIQKVASQSGNEISRLLADYLTFLGRCTKNLPELFRKLRLVKSTLQSLSLAGDSPNSVIVETFVRLVTTMGLEIMQMTAMGDPNSSSSSSGGVTTTSVLSRKTENKALETIFRSALRLEVGFSFPFFENRTDKEYVVGMLNKIKASSSMRFLESNSAIRALQSSSWNAEEQNPEFRNLHGRLYSQSSNAWKGLDFLSR